MLRIVTQVRVMYRCTVFCTVEAGPALYNSPYTVLQIERCRMVRVRGGGAAAGHSSQNLPNNYWSLRPSPQQGFAI